MAISGDLTPEQTQILIDAYERDGTLGSAREATPSIGATTVEPLILEAV